MIGSFDLVDRFALEGNRSPPEMCSGELRDSASSIRLPQVDHNDSTNAIRSFRCAAVKALKLFLAVVAWPACS